MPSLTSRLNDLTAGIATEIRRLGTLINANASTNAGLITNVKTDLVSAINEIKQRQSILSTQTTVDLPSIPAGSYGTAITVTITGCVLGDFCRTSFSLDQNGIIFNAYVSSANTVTVIPYNTTASSTDLSSGVLTVVVNSKTILIGS